MSQQKRLEVMIGIFVLASVVVISAMILAFGGGTSFLAETYRVQIRFNHIGDLLAGAPVKLGGVRIGQVNAIELQENGKIIADASVFQHIKLRQDTQALIQTSGIVGDSFVEFNTGDAPERLAQDGSAIVDGTGQVSTTELLAQVKDIGIKVTELVDNVNTIIGSDQFRKDIHATMANTASASKKAEEFLGDLRKTSGNIFKASEDIRTTTATVRKVVEDVQTKVATEENIKAISDVVQNVRKVSNDATNMSKNLDAILARTDTMFAEEEPKMRAAVGDVAAITRDLRIKLATIKTDTGVLRYFTTDDINRKIDAVFGTLEQPLERVAQMLGHMSKVDLLAAYAKGSRIAKRAEREHLRAGRRTTEMMLEEEYQQELRATQSREQLDSIMLNEKD